MPRTSISPEMRQKARSLRNHATRAESLLWYELREPKAEGLKFRDNQRSGPYIVDFVCPSARLIVEVDGDPQETELARRHDANRDGCLRSLGYAVLRIDEPDLMHDAWHVAQFVKGKVAHLAGDSARPLRGHAPLQGRGELKL